MHAKPPVPIVKHDERAEHSRNRPLQADPGDRQNTTSSTNAWTSARTLAPL